METLNIGAWYWVFGMGPMRLEEVYTLEEAGANGENTEGCRLTMPNGSAYHASKSHVLEAQSTRQLERYRRYCGEGGIYLPPVERWGITTEKGK